MMSESQEAVPSACMMRRYLRIVPCFQTGPLYGVRMKHRQNQNGERGFAPAVGSGESRLNEVRKLIDLSSIAFSS